jgi:hypothetical protein
MIESVRIENFRCFRQVEVRDLRRISVLVGQNASGKTAFLEAVFLARGGSSQMGLKLRPFRGLGPEMQISRDRQGYEAIWKYLFHDLNQERRILVDLTGSGGLTRTLEVFYEQPDSLMLPFGTQSIEAEQIHEVVFLWAVPSGKVLSKAKLSDKGLTFEGRGESEPALFFSPWLRESPAENAARFSALSKQHKESVIVKAIQDEYPFVESLSVEIDMGVATVYASIRGMREKIPMPLVSDGVNKLLGLLLGIAALSGGVVLIDEVENGFFHARLPAIWRLLLKACREFDVQVFATVHSRESLEAAAEASAEDADQFCLIRTEKRNGEVGAVRFSGAEFASAVRHGFEVR